MPALNSKQLKINANKKLREQGYVKKILTIVVV